jgi:hypothetical protein
MSDLLLV